MHNISESMIEEPYAKLEGPHEGKMNDGMGRSALNLRCLTTWLHTGLTGVSGQ
jgi:hypothetical protein